MPSGWASPTEANGGAGGGGGCAFATDGFVTPPRSLACSTSALATGGDYAWGFLYEYAPKPVRSFTLSFDLRACAPTAGEVAFAAVQYSVGGNNAGAVSLGTAAVGGSEPMTVLKLNVGGVVTYHPLGPPLPTERFVHVTFRMKPSSDPDAGSVDVGVDGLIEAGVTAATEAPGADGNTVFAGIYANGPGACTVDLDDVLLLVE